MPTKNGDSRAFLARFDEKPPGPRRRWGVLPSARPSRLALLLPALALYGACADANSSFDDETGLPVERQTATLSANSILLNEVKANPPSTDGAFEFIELIGPAGASLANLHLLSLDGDDGTQLGKVDLLLNLGTQCGGAACSLGSNGLLLLAPSGGHTPPVPETALAITPELDGGGLENGSMTLLLIESATPLAGIDFDPEGDGVLNLPVDATVLDSVAWVDGATDRAYSAAVLTTEYAAEAAVRYASNTAPSDRAGWFFGKLSGESKTLSFGTKVSDPDVANPVLSPGDLNFSRDPGNGVGGAGGTAGTGAAGDSGGAGMGGMGGAAGEGGTAGSSVGGSGDSAGGTSGDAGSGGAGGFGGAATGGQGGGLGGTGSNGGRGGTSGMGGGGAGGRGAGGTHAGSGGSGGAGGGGQAGHGGASGGTAGSAGASSGGAGGASGGRGGTSGGAAGDSDAGGTGGSDGGAAGSTDGGSGGSSGDAGGSGGSGASDDGAGGASGSGDDDGDGDQDPDGGGAGSSGSDGSDGSDHDGGSSSDGSCDTEIADFGFSGSSSDSAAEGIPSCGCRIDSSPAPWPAAPFAAALSIFALGRRSLRRRSGQLAPGLARRRVVR